MKHRLTNTILFSILILVLGLFATNLASAQNTDLSVSPFKGRADASVEIAVFSCFK